MSLQFFSFERVLLHSNKLPMVQPSFRRWPSETVSVITLDCFKNQGISQTTNDVPTDDKVCNKFRILKFFRKLVKFLNLIFITHY